MNAAAPPLLLYLSLSFSCCQTVSCHETDASPPSSLVVSPSQSQFFEYGSVSISCERFGPDGWTVWRQTTSGLQVSPCSVWGSQTSSTCTISTLKKTDSGVYWCESRYRDSSHTVNITVTSKRRMLMFREPQADHPAYWDQTISLEPSRSETSWLLIRGPPASMCYTSMVEEFPLTGCPCLSPDVSKPASLTVSPDSAQVPEYGSFSLSCSSSAPGWTIRRFSDNRKTSSCGGDWGVLSSSSVCSLQTAKKSDSALYWCESPSMQRSNTIQITVHGKCYFVLIASAANPAAAFIHLGADWLNPQGKAADLWVRGFWVSLCSWSIKTFRSAQQRDSSSGSCNVCHGVRLPGFMYWDTPADPDPPPSSPLHSILWKILYAPVSIFYLIPSCICIYKLRATGWSPAGRTRTSGPRRAPAAAEEEEAAGGGDYDDAMNPVTTEHRF
uniref:Ig-like domain-containing protein n=1 Tax=Poecilia formosa TaxID=48698 RepID=A0A096LS42_POEFO